MTQHKMDAKHLAEWANGSGIPEYLIRANVRSYNSRKEIGELLGWGAPCESGWFVQSRDPQTNKLRNYGQFKPDTAVNLGGRRAKYLTPKGLESQGIFLLNPKDPLFWKEVLSSNDAVYITEGAKKAAALLQYGKAAIALTGVWNGLIKRQQLIEDLALFAKPGRKVFICFDSDQVNNSNVSMAISCLQKAFEQRECKVCNILLPINTKGRSRTNTPRFDYRLMCLSPSMIFC